MFSKRSFLALASVAFLAACAGPAPKEGALAPEQAASIRLATYALDLSAVGPDTAGRKIPIETVKTELQKAIADNLVPRGTGKDTQVVLKVDSVNILSIGQSLLIGGESVMRGSVALVDKKTGEILVEPVAISSGGGGWAAGGLLGAATLEDRSIELQQISVGFAINARRALLGS